MTVAKSESTITISPIKSRTIMVSVVGIRPFIFHRMAAKAQRELLLPKGRKTAADRASTLKHDPYEEYRGSAYTIRDERSPTLLGIPASMFKAAMMSAALRLPGTKRTEIAQLLWVEGDLLPAYGIPEIFLSVTRSSDINKTPDVRTRLIVKEWATSLTITYCEPILNETSVVNLLSAAGMICGVGDWRPEKGKGTYGQFSLTNEDDERYARIVRGGGREVQMKGFVQPSPYDEETEELLGWFDWEVTARGKSATKGGG